jgi:hypothetical protein
MEPAVAVRCRPARCSWRACANTIPRSPRASSSHATGTPAPSLQGIALVVFWLGDPLRQKYPDCYAEASEIAAAATRRAIPLINAPDGLSNTAKAVQSDIWAAAGIPSAPVRHVTTGHELLYAYDKLDGACMMRGNETSRRARHPRPGHPRRSRARCPRPESTGCAGAHLRRARRIPPRRRAS